MIHQWDLEERFRYSNPLLTDVFETFLVQGFRNTIYLKFIQACGIYLVIVITNLTIDKIVR